MFGSVKRNQAMADEDREKFKEEMIQFRNKVTNLETNCAQLEKVNVHLTTTCRQMASRDDHNQLIKKVAALPTIKVTNELAETFLNYPTLEVLEKTKAETQTQIDLMNERISHAPTIAEVHE